MSESFTLRVRGEEIGRAFGLENWLRAASFVCDRFGRTATTPRWAFDATSAPSTGAPSGHHETNPGGALYATGGIVTGSGHTLVGEQGCSLEVPLSNLTKGTSGNGADLDRRDHEGWD
jgi:hypothetical protein